MQEQQLETLHRHSFGSGRDVTERPAAPAGVPLAIRPAVRLKCFSSHAAKAALALKAPSVTTFDANVAAHASF